MSMTSLTVASRPSISPMDPDGCWSKANRGGAWDDIFFLRDLTAPLHCGAAPAKLQICTRAQTTHIRYLSSPTLPAFGLLFSSFFLHVDNTSENHFYSIRPLLCSLKEPQIPPGLMNDILGALQ